MKLSEKLFFSRRPTLLWCLFLFSFLIVYASSALCSEVPIVVGKNQMTFDEAQDLSIMNYQTGNTYTWSIQDDDGQKGTLSSTTGGQVTYIAPSSNPGCVNNPTIRVSCCGDQTGTITISVNEYISTDAVVSMKHNMSCIQSGQCGGGGLINYVCWMSCSVWQCDGTLRCQLLNHPCYGCTTDPMEIACAECLNGCGYSYPGWNCYHCNCGGGYMQEGEYRDCRTAAEKAGGCCPEVLLPGYEPKPIIPRVDHGMDPSTVCPVGDKGLVGNPIRIYNGNNVEAEEDIRFSSPNRRQLIFKRFYNSRSGSTGPMGYGWTHTYNASLDPSYEFGASYYLRIIDETGRGVYFEDAGSGHYVGAFKEQTTVEVEAGDYVWYRLDDSRHAFNAQGQLIWIEDDLIF